MNENVTVCITPKGEKPVLHFSQFDNERVFTVTVLADDGESAAVLTGLDIEFRIRKTDSHVVTIAPESVADNVITFKTTEQMCACCGQNIASVTLMKDDMNIATLDILVDIQRDILSGGLTSESDIRNLTTQIETIIPEVLADDYYTKTEVDDLIDEIPTFDPTNYYDKSDVDSLLADKADLSDLPDMSDYYTKSDVDTLLMDRMGNIEFTSLASGSYPIISFNSSYKAPIISIEGEITTSTNTINLVRCGKNLALRSLTGINIDSSGTLVPYATFDMVIAPVKAGQTFTATNNESNQFICGFFTSVPKQGDSSYNNTRVVQSSKTFTAPIDGFIAFRIPTGFTEYQLELGLVATEYVPFNGELKEITLDTTVSSGSVNFALGTINDSGTIITFTPVTVDAVTGVNNVFIDVGNLTTLTYVSDADLGLMELLEAYTKR